MEAGAWSWAQRVPVFPRLKFFTCGGVQERWLAFLSSRFAVARRLRGVVVPASEKDLEGPMDFENAYIDQIEHEEELGRVDKGDEVEFSNELETKFTDMAKEAQQDFNKACSGQSFESLMQELADRAAAEKKLEEAEEIGKKGLTAGKKQALADAAAAGRKVDVGIGHDDSDDDSDAGKGQGPRRLMQVELSDPVSPAKIKTQPVTQHTRGASWVREHQHSAFLSTNLVR